MFFKKKHVFLLCITNNSFHHSTGDVHTTTASITSQEMFTQLLSMHWTCLHLHPYCSWMTHAQSTSAVPVPPCSCLPRGPQPDHCSRTCSLMHRQCRRNILVAQVTWLLRTCYPSAHPRMCYPSAHPRTCYPSAWYNLSYKPAPPLQSSLHHRLLPWSWLRWGGAASPGGSMPSWLDFFSCTTPDSCTAP